MAHLPEWQVPFEANGYTVTSALVNTDFWIVTVRPWASGRESTYQVVGSRITPAIVSETDGGYIYSRPTIGGASIREDERQAILDAITHWKLEQSNIDFPLG